MRSSSVRSTVRPLDLLLPERCVGCERPGRALCAECRRAFTRLVPPVCARCGSPGPWPVRRCAECAGRRLAFVEARSAVVYDASGEDIRSRLEGARTPQLGARGGATRRGDGSAAAVGMPRPRAGRSRARPGTRRRPGASARAVELESLWGLPMFERARAKPRSLPRQRGFSLTERRRNVRGSVVARGPLARGRLSRRRRLHVGGDRRRLCGRAAGVSGARRVRVVTFARAVR